MSRTFSSGVSIVFRKLHGCSHLIFSPTLLFSSRFILVQLWKSSLQPCLLLPTKYFYILPCWYLDRPIKPRQDIDVYLLELDTRFARKIFTRLFCFQTELSSMTSVNYLNETWLRMRQKQIVLRIPVTWRQTSCLIQLETELSLISTLIETGRQCLNHRKIVNCNQSILYEWALTTSDLLYSMCVKLVYKLLKLVIEHFLVMSAHHPKRRFSYTFLSTRIIPFSADVTPDSLEN